MELSRLHVPHRWLSLRNVMAFFNILILIAAIAIVAIVSFYAGTESTRNAVGAMSSIAVGDISMKLDDILGNAEMATGCVNDSRANNVQVHADAVFTARQ